MPRSIYALQCQNLFYNHLSTRFIKLGRCKRAGAAGHGESALTVPSAHGR